LIGGQEVPGTAEDLVRSRITSDPAVHRVSTNKVVAVGPLEAIIGTSFEAIDKPVSQAPEFEYPTCSFHVRPLKQAFRFSSGLAEVPMSDIKNWSNSAAQWIAWVRTDNHDAFWAYQTAFEVFVGPGTGQAIELGAGEGRIARVLGALGWQMTLVEPVPELRQAAEEAGSAATYVTAPANVVPAEAAQFDLVVLYNMLMDVDDLDGTIAEARRLMRPDGRVIAGIVHPIADVIQAREEGDPNAPCFVARPVDDTMERDGLTMRFCGWRRPLSDYVNAFARAGLVVTRMSEPAPDPDHPASERFTKGHVIPIFLWLELRPFP